ncbi:MAG: lyase family protein [Phycisphaerales bacterium]
MASSSPHDRYQSPLAGRYASDEMQTIWSARHKFSIWRKIWLAVAQAQHECALPVTQEQIDELSANLDVTDNDIAAAAKYEAELRHDVMAQVHAWGDRCPKARGIIHLGMTSQDINDNCELIQLHQAYAVIEKRIAALLVAMGDFADKWKATPTLGFTHYQPAQPTTVGRRCAQWAYDLIEHTGHNSLVDGVGKLRGLRGATGTQASFLALCEGDAKRVRDLEVSFFGHLGRLIEYTDSLEHSGWWESEDRIRMVYAGRLDRLKTHGADPEIIERVEAERDSWLERSDDDRRDEFKPAYLQRHSFALTGQTYPRIVDSRVVAELASICSVLHKTATDIRLLSNRKELDEPFAEKQIGSSAMPYKRNPMRCERVCGLARFVWNLVGNTYDTAATQWLERTLDDSANRRLTLPEAFLATDACLSIMTNVLSGLIVHEATVRKNLMAELPFMASENLMMEAVKRGKDRQEVHEAIRQHAQLAGSRVKDEGADNDLIERLRSEPLLEGVDLDAALDPSKYVGLAVQQTEAFISDYIAPLREKYGDRQDADDLKL